MQILMFLSLNKSRLQLSFVDDRGSRVFIRRYLKCDLSIRVNNCLERTDVFRIVFHLYFGSFAKKKILGKLNIIWLV